MRRFVVRSLAAQSIAVHSLWLLALYSSTGGWSVSPIDWLHSLHQWDALWYASIAHDGHGFLPHSYAFSPGFGWLLRGLTEALAWLTPLSWAHRFYIAGFVVSLASYAIANTVIVNLGERRFALKRPRLWLGAIANPAGYFALTAYSDAFFFLLLSLALWLALEQARSRRARLALTALLLIMPWFRLTGLALLSWITVRRKEALAVLASFLGFMLYYWLRTDRPLFFLVPQVIFGMPEGNGLQGLQHAVSVFAEGLSALLGFEIFLQWLVYGLVPVVVLTLSLLLAGWFASRREWLFAVTVLSITLMSHNQALWRSTLRYALPFFPMLPWMLLAGRRLPAENKLWRRVLYAAWVGLALTFQVIFARVFQAGEWAF